VAPENKELKMADDMTQQELQVAMTAAKYILNKLSMGCELERWQISKIVLASDYLSSVHSYMCAQDDIAAENGASSGEETENETETESEIETEDMPMVFVLKP
jgi:hypothetical protein